VKRHPQLQPLSDDHHAALVLAREMRRAGEANDAAALAAAWKQARVRFARELEPHFQTEETALFPALEAAGEADLARRAREEHARLREGIARPPDAAAARAFGSLLHAHVRFEERALFPRAEHVLDEATLAEVGRAARAARGKAG
jgi:hemerythrin-like domain-containing protein